MTSPLISGKLQAIIGKAVNKTLAYPVTLHKRPAGQDRYGNPVDTWTDYALQGLHLEKSAASVFYEGAPEGSSEVVITQLDATAAPEMHDQVTARGVRYDILGTKEDPAQATWVCTVTVADTRAFSAAETTVAQEPDAVAIDFGDQSAVVKTDG